MIARGVNPRRQEPELIKAKSHGLPRFLRSQRLAHRLLRNQSFADQQWRRETRSRKRYIRRSHEGNHTQRVCITSIDRNHRPCARVRPCHCHTGHSGGGKRKLAVGTDSMWRCCEWAQWFWSPHGQGRVSNTRKPRRATVKRGPHITRTSLNRALSFYLEEGKRSVTQ